MSINLEKEVQEIVKRVEDWPEWKKRFSSYPKDNPLLPKTQMAVTRSDDSSATK
jgi:hypothetical protein